MQTYFNTVKILSIIFLNVLYINMKTETQKENIVGATKSMSVCEEIAVAMGVCFAVSMIALIISGIYIWYVVSITC